MPLIDHDLNRERTRSGPWLVSDPLSGINQQLAAFDHQNDLF